MTRCTSPYASNTNDLSIKPVGSSPETIWEFRRPKNFNFPRATAQSAGKQALDFSSALLFHL